MIKLDKNTHILILLVFVLSFVVVYLYFTINDVRKLQKEHKKLADDLVSLQQQIVMSQQQPPVMAFIPPLPTGQAFPAQAPSKVNNQKLKVPETVPEILDDESEEDEDNESVDTEEIRNTLDNTDAEETAEENDVDANEDNVPEEDDQVQVIKYTQEELLTLKNDELKELCKKHQIPVKGSKEVLIKRLLSL